MSAPTPAPGDDRPREGYYPDPSIPGYVRFWNGASWVPGTSRPAPSDGASVAARVEETGPHFFDEDPRSPGAEPRRATPADAQHGSRPEPASAWGADRSHQSGFGGDRDRQVSWGSRPRPPTRGRPTPGPPSSPRSSRTDGRPVRTGRRRSRRSSRTPRRARVGHVRVPPAHPGTGRRRRRPLRGHHDFPRALPAHGARKRGGRRAAGEHEPPGGPQGPVTAPAPAPAQGPGFGAGKAAAARAAAAQGAAPAPLPAPPAVPRQNPSRHRCAHGPRRRRRPALLGPAGAPPGRRRGGRRTARHALEAAVEDVFQAAARRQAEARPAGLGKRLAARLVDTLVLGALTAVAAVPLGSLALDHVTEKIDAAKVSGETVTVWLLDGTTGCTWASSWPCCCCPGSSTRRWPTAKWGRTLGKKLLGLEVRDIEGHEPPSFGAALRRWLVYCVPGLLGIGVVGVLWCLFDRPWRQGWHDKAAHTFVAG